MMYLLVILSRGRQIMKLNEQLKNHTGMLYAALLLTAYLIIVVSTAARADQAYGYILPESSWRYLDYSEITDMPLQVICYAKNEIYARNGRKFRSAELQNYFNTQYWYCGMYTPEQFTEGMLNCYEAANVDLLSSREAEFGDYQLDCSGYDFSAVYAYMQGYYSRSTAGDSYYVDPDSYILYDSDRRYITDGEIAQMSLQEINYAKNEIFARRGRIFQSQELSSYFSQKNWYYGYISPEQFSDALLNGYELSNAAALKAAEFARQSSGYALDQPGYTYSAIGSYTQNYVYAPEVEEYLIWDSSIRYLDSSEVSWMSLKQLNYARNEIYARRGYIFQSQELRDYFGEKYWYYGIVSGSQFSYDLFNEYEKANIELLKRYEYSLNPNGYQLY